MPKLRVHNFAISVDGYGAGPSQSLDNPLGVGGLSLIDVEQGWVFATLALACVIMLSSGIFASWLLVLQIGVPSSEKP